MPLHSYHCDQCGHEFETLVQGNEQAACPSCQSLSLSRLLGRTAPMGKTEAAMGSIRRQAAREGHFSNYSPAELKR